MRCFAKVKREGQGLVHMPRAEAELQREIPVQSWGRRRRGTEEKESRGRQKIPESYAQGLKFALVGVHACEIRVLTNSRATHWAQNHTLHISTLFNFPSANSFLFFNIIINFMAFVCFNFIK